MTTAYPRISIRGCAYIFSMLAFFVLCGLSMLAYASEYPLESVAFLTPDEIAALKKLPAGTTHEAGKALAKPKARANAGKKTGLKKRRLDEVAKLFDLMRVKGMGPRMALLFRAAGVVSCATLAKEVPEELVKRLLKANSEKSIANKIPDAAILADWISQAKSLPGQYVASR